MAGTEVTVLHDLHVRELRGGGDRMGETNETSRPELAPCIFR